MRGSISFFGLVGFFLSVCPCCIAAGPGCWSGENAPAMKEDIYTKSKLGQWTESFENEKWGPGSWVDGEATNAAGQLIWKLRGPKIVKSHPSVFFDSNGDNLPDMIQTHYQGGKLTLYDAPTLWGDGAVFDCEDTFIEDHFDPIKKKYEYGYVDIIAVNKKLGLVLYTDARVIETSGAKSHHSGEMTFLTMTIVPDRIRQAIEKQFPRAHIRSLIKKAKNKLPYYEIDVFYQGRKIRTDVSPEGVLCRARSVARPDEIPQAVTDAIKEKLSGKKIRKIERHDTFAEIQAGNWTLLETPKLVFSVKYLDDGKRKSLPVELRPLPYPDNDKIWGHNGRAVQPFSPAKAANKAAKNFLRNLIE